MDFARRMSRLGTETAFEVLAAARALESQGREIIHLEIGEPDFNPPDSVVEAAVRAMHEGWHHYVPANGVQVLREAVAEEVARTRGIPVDPEEVVITPGAKPIIFFSLLALAEQGWEVIYPDPGFPIYESMIRFTGAVPVPLPLREEQDFRIDVDELAGLITDRTRLIIINSPSNPTGSVLTAEDIRRLAETLAGRPVMVLSDEIYSRILYEGSHASIASQPGMKEHTILLDGFSKTYAMTGWRLGYGVMPRQLAAAVVKLMINSNSCTAAFTQIAGVAALRGDQGPVTRMVETFRRRRDRVVELLNQVEGVSCRTPQGAFYAFPNIRNLGLTSQEVQRRLLHEYGVAVLSGTAFGRWGEGYVRLSYAASMQSLERGIDRLAALADAVRRQNGSRKGRE
ncbi:MAG: pyridoxal phosphate-dependent aminotransferase [Acidobacteriota bacterium]